MSHAAPANAKQGPAAAPPRRSAHESVQGGQGGAAPAVSALPTWSAARLATAGALVAVGVGATLGAWADIAHIALNDEESSHILLVPLIAAWLIWNRRDSLKNLPTPTSALGPALIVVGGLLNSYGFYNMTQALWQAGAVLVAIGCLVTVLGWRVLWKLLPAFVVLAFVVPVPGMLRQKISIPLQEATAAATAGVLHAFAVNITQHGSVLRFNGQDVAVAEACNGMRMVFALLLVTYAVAFATPLRNWVRAAILLLSPLLAILCNIIRLVPTVWVFGYYPKTIAPVFHDFSGWAMIAVAFGLVLGIIRVLEWAQIPIMQPQTMEPHP